ncbi:hypothetical protein SLS62_005109 [Diatrype stigma]|uniref:Uncharacterized protein n=1 Tax=Diatrype stigma TaxID=117547 RepID=A0AAN9UVH7_9PEZI
MGSAKEAAASQDAGQAQDPDPDQLPSYAEASSASIAQAASSSAGQQQQSSTPRGKGPAAGPTVASPFDFSSLEASPPYALADQSALHKPIAIPQAHPDPASPFLVAYAPALLGYGIPGESWDSFLETVSAFLAARVSERALAHAADIGRAVGNVPLGIGKTVANRARHLGHSISERAKHGDILGVARGVIGGAVSLPVGAALGAVGAAVRLPGSAAVAVTRKPQTPRERVDAYLAVANKDWFGPRGLHTRILDTAQLAQFVGAPGSEAGDGEKAGQHLIDIAGHARPNQPVETQLETLERYIGELEVIGSAASLEIGLESLWLVVLRKEEKDKVREKERNKEKEKEREREKKEKEKKKKEQEREKERAKENDKVVID